jgi:hypothetical protein
MQTEVAPTAGEKGRTFCITSFLNLFAKGGVEETLTLEGLRQKFGNYDPRDDKDGECFTPGRYEGGRKKKSAAREVHILPFDFDGTFTLDDLDRLMDGAGIKAFLSSSTQHGPPIGVQK